MVFRFWSGDSGHAYWFLFLLAQEKTLGDTMAKKATKKSKKSDDHNFLDAIKTGIGVIADVGLNAIIGNLRSAAEDAMTEAQKRLEVATAHVLKSATIFFIMVFGLVLAVVGLGTWLSASYVGLANGLGHVLVGVILIALGLLIQFFRK